MAFAQEAILKIAASAALMERGCVYVIGLDDVRAQMGERWDKRKETVWARLEILLSHKLGQTDCFLQLDELSFLVSMPTAMEEEAQVFCLRIAHDLHHSLLGCCETEKLCLARACALEGDKIVSAPIAGPALQSLAVRAGLAPPGISGATLPGDALTPRASPQPFVQNFTPFWDAQKQAITSYRSSACLNPASDPRFDTHFKQELSQTLACISGAAGCLSRHLALGERVMVWLPMSYEILTSPIGRMEIAGLSRGLSAELRPYLVFEICDLPQGVPQSRLTELVGSLRPFCRGVAACLSAPPASYGPYLSAGLLGIGLSLAGADGRDAAVQMLGLSRAATRQHIASYALNISDKELLQTARTLGINLLSGPMIGLSQPDLAPIRRLHLQDVLASRCVAV